MPSPRAECGATTERYATRHDPDHRCAPCSTTTAVGIEQAPSTGWPRPSRSLSRPRAPSRERQPYARSGPTPNDRHRRQTPSEPPGKLSRCQQLGGAALLQSLGRASSVVFLRRPSGTPDIARRAGLAPSSKPISTQCRTLQYTLPERTERLAIQKRHADTDSAPHAPRPPFPAAAERPTPEPGQNPPSVPTRKLPAPTERTGPERIPDPRTRRAWRPRKPKPRSPSAAAPNPVRTNVYQHLPNPARPEKAQAPREPNAPPTRLTSRPASSSVLLSAGTAVPAPRFSLAPNAHAGHPPPCAERVRSPSCPHADHPSEAPATDPPHPDSGTLRAARNPRGAAGAASRRTREDRARAPRAGSRNDSS